MSASATPKSVLLKIANMMPTYSAKVACEKEKAEFSTKQTCHDEPNMSRRVQEVSHSRFCKRFSTHFR